MEKQSREVGPKGILRQFGHFPVHEISAPRCRWLPPFGGTNQLLSDRFVDLPIPSGIEQLLVGSRILNDYLGAAVRGENHGAPGLFQPGNKVAGTPPEICHG